MSQVTNYTIPGSPLNMMQLAVSLNAMFAASVSANRGASAPANPFEGMLWWDTSADPVETLKRYTVVAGWVSLADVDITTGTVSFYRAGMALGTMAVEAATDYIKNTLMTTQGDIIYASAANTPARLGKGPAGYFLKQGAAAPEWAAIPSPPSDGSAATPSLRTLGTGAAQACAGNDARLSDTRTPTDGSVTLAKVSSTIKDAAAGTASMRTLGVGANQACAGNDSRLMNGAAIAQMIFSYAVGNVLETSNSAVTEHWSTTSYTKIKTLYVARPGAVRIKFGMKAYDGNTAYGRIYKNGVAVGTQRSTTERNSYQTYSEDFSGLVIGDLIQLYVKSSNSHPVYTNSFQLYVAAGVPPWDSYISVNDAGGSP